MMDQKLSATMFEEEGLRAASACFAESLWDWDDRRFTRAEYPSSFREYSERFSPLFLALQQACEQHPERTEQLLCELCGGAVTLVAERLAAIRSRNDRLVRQDICKMVAVVYFTPAVGELAISVGGALVQTMCEAWAQRFPKDRYALVGYSEIAKGFERKWYQCYITQAVCEQFGLPDDCNELQTLRAFRDGYLRACPDGPALIDEYYRCAPQIICRIWASDRRDEVYAAVWSAYLQPCLRDIRDGRPDMCKRRYEQMVRTLRRCYLPWAEV